LPRFLAVWALSYTVPPPDEAFLYGMVVHPDYRRRSAARSLTVAAEERSRQFGKRVTRLTVERTNTPSLRLVESLGYQAVAPPPRSRLRRMVAPEPTFIQFEKVL
jgi:ribosomal protein S18 acetylase RimI-like enzyme